MEHYLVRYVSAFRNRERTEDMHFSSRVMIIAVLAFLGIATVRADAASGTYPVGVAQIEYVTTTDHRPMWMAVFYPAALKDPAATQFRVPFTINLRLYTD